MAATPTMEELLVKMLTEPKSWTLNSRYVMIALFYGVLKEKYQKKKDALPSIDAAALDKMNNPIAEELKEIRSMNRTLASLNNVSNYLHWGHCFDIFEGNPDEVCGQFAFTVTYDNVERIFSDKERSIPLNVDKDLGRKSFIAPEGYEWIGFDWDRAELVLLALAAQDGDLKQALAGDFHTHTAEIIKEHLTEVPEGVNLREVAKTAIYALIYAGFATDVAAPILKSKVPSISADDAKLIMELIVNAYPILFEYVETMAEEWMNSADPGTTYFFNAFRAIQHPTYPLNDVKQALNNRQCRVAINCVGQNSVGILLKHVMAQIAFSDYMKDIRSSIPVFDALYFLVPSDKADEIIKFITEVAQLRLEHNGFEIDLNLSWSRGSSWGELEDIETPQVERQTLHWASDN